MGNSWPRWKDKNRTQFTFIFFLLFVFVDSGNKIIIFGMGKPNIDSMDIVYAENTHKPPEEDDYDYFFLSVFGRSKELHWKMKRIPLSAPSYRRPLMGFFKGKTSIRFRIGISPSAPSSLAFRFHFSFGLRNSNVKNHETKPNSGIKWPVYLIRLIYGFILIRVSVGTLSLGRSYAFRGLVKLISARKECTMLIAPQRLKQNKNLWSGQNILHIRAFYELIWISWGNRPHNGETGAVVATEKAHKKKSNASAAQQSCDMTLWTVPHSAWMHFPNPDTLTRSRSDRGKSGCIKQV